MSQYRSPYVNNALDFLDAHCNNKTVFKITHNSKHRHRNAGYASIGVYNGITKKYAVYSTDRFDSRAFDDIKVTTLAIKK